MKQRNGNHRLRKETRPRSQSHVLTHRCHSINIIFCLLVCLTKKTCLFAVGQHKKKKKKKKKEKRIFQSINMYRYVSMYIGAVSSRLMRRYWYDSAGMNGGNSHVSDGGRWFPSRLSSLVWIGRMELEVRLPPPPPPPPPPTVNYADLIDDTKEKKKSSFSKNQLHRETSAELKQQQQQQQHFKEKKNQMRFLNNILQ